MILVQRPTIGRARKALRPPLRFGDERQIQAHEFWVAVLLAIDHRWGCRDCESIYPICPVQAATPKHVWHEAMRIVDRQLTGDRQ